MGYVGQKSVRVYACATKFQPIEKGNANAISVTTDLRYLLIVTRKFHPEINICMRHNPTNYPWQSWLSTPEIPTTLLGLNEVVVSIAFACFSRDDAATIAERVSYNEYKRINLPPPFYPSILNRFVRVSF